MASVPFHYVDLRAFCYVTEDRKRVADALRTFIPDDDELELDYAETEGFNGDRILVVSIRLERADEMRHVLSKLTELDDIDTVVRELDHRVDEDCTFFLTLDKQAAFRGDVVRGDGITLRAKVEAYPAKKEHAVENVAETLASLRGD
ncbi:RNA-binding protein [Halosegnis longus]|uniref:RNA-binding protein n=1 Tax=Halosegnis longus TaxID=2216012 RepID=A0AAJ4R8G1_9EURY|nr:MULTISPECIES: RNA-binding protein [Halobacteriales]RNJ26157.1 RNA-binding protein [Salella cibi]